MGECRFSAKCSSESLKMGHGYLAFRLWKRPSFSMPGHPSNACLVLLLPILMPLAPSKTYEMRALAITFFKECSLYCLAHVFPAALLWNEESVTTGNHSVSSLLPMLRIWVRFLISHLTYSDSLKHAPQPILCFLKPPPSSVIRWKRDVGLPCPIPDGIAIFISLRANPVKQIGKCSPVSSQWGAHTNEHSFQWFRSPRKRKKRFILTLLGSYWIMVWFQPVILSRKDMFPLQVVSLAFRVMFRC